MWRQTLTALALAFRISAVIITTTLGLLFLGIFVDRQVGTSPFGVLCFMIFGVTSSTISVYLIVTRSFPQAGIPSGQGRTSSEEDRWREETDEHDPWKDED